MSRATIRRIQTASQRYGEDIAATIKEDTGGAYDLPDAFELEPDILRSEGESAIKKLRNRKSPGSTAETIKAMGEMGIDIFWVLCNRIWREGKWPSEWCESIFVPIFKKGSRIGRLL